MKTLIKLSTAGVLILLLAFNVFARGETDKKEAPEKEKEVISTQQVPVEQHVFSTVEEYERITGKKVKDFKEAPMLKEKVAAGEIPPLEKRLPEEPLVVSPFEEIGQYGGTARVYELSVWDIEGLWYVIAGEPLVNWNESKTKMIPNIFKSWEISDDGKVFTFHLRKGIKWSDGVPFTADDIIFWYEDVLLNEDLTPEVAWRYKFGGELVKVEKLDNYTIRFNFFSSFKFFINFMAGGGGEGESHYRCSHYLKQFHPRYVSKEKLSELTKKAGFDNWYDLFNDKCKNHLADSEVPTIGAWKIISGFDRPYMIAERNPYYWKVDTEGNQLPYIDKWKGEIVNSEIGAMRAIAGEIDFGMWGVGSAIKMQYALFMENRDKGDYRLVKIGPENANEMNIYFNLTYKKDLVLGDILANKKFRIACSLGIDREEINELVYDGRAIPTQGHGVPGRPWYIESLTRANTEYDPEKANKLLDEMGLNKRNKEGIRLRSDGKPLSVVIETGTNYSKSCELIADHWTKDLGIKTMVKIFDWSAISDKVKGNELQVIGRWGNGDIYNPFIDAYHYAVAVFAPLWFDWLQTDGKDGEEPPNDIKRLHKIMKEEGYSASNEKRNELLKEVMKLWSDNQWGIGTVYIPYGERYMKRNFRNYPEGRDIATWWPGGEFCHLPCQWFLKK